MPDKTIADACPDCGVVPGEHHLRGCDIEPCPRCGRQLISCGCADRPPLPACRVPWTGLWPGFFECRQFGWFNRPAEGGRWVRYGPKEEGASEDLGRLALEARWDRRQMQFVLPRRR